MPGSEPARPVVLTPSSQQVLETDELAQCAQGHQHPPCSSSPSRGARSPPRCWPCRSPPRPPSPSTTRCRALEDRMPPRRRHRGRRPARKKRQPGSQRLQPLLEPGPFAQGLSVERDREPRRVDPVERPPSMVKASASRAPRTAPEARPCVPGRPQGARGESPRRTDDEESSGPARTRRSRVALARSSAPEVRTCVKGCPQGAHRESAFGSGVPTRSGGGRARTRPQSHEARVDHSGHRPASATGWTPRLGPARCPSSSSPSRNLTLSPGLNLSLSPSLNLSLSLSLSLGRSLIPNPNPSPGPNPNQARCLSTSSPASP